MTLYNYLANEYRLDSWYRYYPPTIIVNNINQEALDEYIEEKMKDQIPNLSKDFVDNIVNYINEIVDEKINTETEEETPAPDQPPDDPQPVEEPEEPTTADLTLTQNKTDGAITLTLNGDLQQHYHWLVIFDYTIQEFITEKPELKLDNLYYHMYNNAERVKVIIHAQKKSQEFIIK